MLSALLVLLETLLLIVPVLLSIAVLTLAERKLMGSMQRRVGPNTTGLFGFGQPIADGLKLFIKEIILPTESDKSLFIIPAFISIYISLSIFIVLPLIPGYSIVELDLSLLLTLAFGGIAIYSILLSGWAANSKYSVMGSMRSSAQMMSYELSIGLMLIGTLLGSSYNISDISDSQTIYPNLLLNLPLALIYFISILAETNRAPFDLPEAESELVSGFNTEHSSLPFAFFFLGEYGFMISQSIIFVYLYLAGTNIPLLSLPSFMDPIILTIKISIVLFLFVWIRATLPRFRYDLLQDLAWNGFLPMALTWVLVAISINI